MTNGRTTASHTSMTLAVLEYYALPSETAIFVVRSDRDDVILERAGVTRDAIRAAAVRLAGDFAPENINPTHPEWSSDLAFLDPLADALLGPVMRHIDGVDMLYVVPHGYLFYLPFHALRPGAGRYLVEDRAVAYAPSAALVMNARLRRRAEKAATFVGLGTGKADDPPERQRGFEAEVRTIAELPFWQQRDAFTGVEASTSAFLNVASQADVIHCACHGYFDEVDPLSSGLLLSDGERLPAWPPDGTGRERFLLSARTLAPDTLRADLVYLSACVSGRHDIRPGDEILGLVRALTRAGATSIVASLWPIAAWASTRMLMETFYTRWLVDGLSKAHAMRAAQIDTMEKFPHPYHWAPFTLVGDWC